MSIITIINELYAKNRYLRYNNQRRTPFTLFLEKEHVWTDEVIITPNQLYFEIRIQRSIWRASQVIDFKIDKGGGNLFNVNGEYCLGYEHIPYSRRLCSTISLHCHTDFNGKIPEEVKLLIFEDCCKLLEELHREFFPEQYPRRNWLERFLFCKS